MRAIGVLKVLLLVGLMADAGAALAIEDMTQGRPSRSSQGLVQELHFERKFQDRHFDRRSADLFAPERGGGFASPVAAGQFVSGQLTSGQLGSGSFVPGSITGSALTGNVGSAADEGFTALEQQRNIIKLQQRIAAARMRSAGDVWLLGLIGVMLVAYQLCRKHRFLRPQPFTL